MASRKNSPRRPLHGKALAPTPRHLWLASLGVLVAVRCQSGLALQRATTLFGQSIQFARKARKTTAPGARKRKR